MRGVGGRAKVGDFVETRGIRVASISTTMRTSSVMIATSEFHGWTQKSVEHESLLVKFGVPQQAAFMYMR